MFKLVFFQKGQLNKKVLIIILSSLIASFASSGIAYVVTNATADLVKNDHISMTNFFMFMFVFVTFITTKRYSLRLAIIFIERTLESFRNKIANQLRQTELINIEELDEGEIFTKLTWDTKNLARASWAVIKVLQAITLITCVTIGIFWFSILYGFILTGVFVICFLAYQLRSASMDRDIHVVTDKETELFENLGHLMNGFKELKIDHDKNVDFFHTHLKPLTETVMGLNIKIGKEFAKMEAFFFIFAFYMALSTILFLLPNDIPVSIKFKITSLSLFLIHPISTLSFSIPEMFSGNVSAARLHQLEQKLELKIKPVDFIQDYKNPDFYDLKEILIKNLHFNYNEKGGSQTFSIGPLSFSIKGGKILFLTGGNGSGKSTLLKVLNGLYTPDAGIISINNSEVNIADHRYLFSVIYTDCHILDSLYGVDNLNDKEVIEWISKMGLSHKVKWQDDKFIYSGLSAGQKKRLAFVASILEDRPIYLFDEWAAEQDPEFKKYFYEELLSHLKNKGKTIIAVTHDDRYFHVADQVIKMEYGQICENRFKN